jgi:hypothetical protein
MSTADCIAKPITAALISFGRMHRGMKCLKEGNMSQPGGKCQFENTATATKSGEFLERHSRAIPHLSRISGIELYHAMGVPTHVSTNPALETRIEPLQRPVPAHPLPGACFLHVPHWPLPAARGDGNSQLFGCLQHLSGRCEPRNDLPDRTNSTTAPACATKPCRGFGGVPKLLPDSFRLLTQGQRG